VVQLGYAFYREGPTFIQFNPGSSGGQPLDLMLVNSETFAKLALESVSLPPIIGGAKTVSLQHLLALKCHAVKHGHEGRIVKDADDVIQLVLANQIELNTPAWRELFLKHGTAEFYEKVTRACKQC
jgi:hypothetical protein